MGAEQCRTSTGSMFQCVDDASPLTFWFYILAEILRTFVNKTSAILSTARRRASCDCARVEHSALFLGPNGREVLEPFGAIHSPRRAMLHASEDVKAFAARRLDTERTKQGPNFRPS